MISSIPPPHTTRPIGAPSRLCPSGTPASSPDIDFSTVDTVQKAALLPNLNWLTLLDNSTTFYACNQVGFGFDWQMKMSVGDSTELSLQAHMDPKHPRMTVEGTVGGNRIHEVWSGSGTVVHIDGTIGASPEKLTLKSIGSVVTLDGTVGAIEVHEKLIARDHKGLLTGTIGGQPVNQTTLVSPVHHGVQTLTWDGAMGDASVSCDETSTFVGDGNGGYNFSGQGNIAGTPIKFEQSMRYVRPD